jgi:GT2 family glycosyltransferase
MKSYHVTCIIVTYNPISWIDKVLEFLKNENIFQNTIFIDNNSIDGFKDFAKHSIPPQNLILLDENLGFGAANNIGIKHAIERNSDCVLLLNQDAWIEVGGLSKMIDILYSKQELSIVSPLHYNSEYTFLDKNFIDYFNQSNFVRYFSDENQMYINCEFVNAAIWLIKIESILKIGGFNPSFFHYGEDDEYCLRTIKKGFEIGIAPMVKGVHDRYFRQKEISLKQIKYRLKNKFRINFFRSDDNYPFSKECIRLLLNKGYGKTNLLLRLSIFLELLIERSSLLRNKNEIKINPMPFLN